MFHENVVPAKLDYRGLVQALSKSSDFGRSERTPAIAVIGDYCLDKYLYVYPSLDEASVETGITAFQVRGKRLFAGVGGTIAGNLRALGAETHCFGVIGDDGEGYDLLKALKGIGANVEGVVVSPDVLTGVYMKPMRPDPETNPECVDESGRRLPEPGVGTWLEGARIDIRNPVPVSSNLVDKLKRRFLEKLPSFDAVVVSDQFPTGSESLFSNEFRSFISEVARKVPDVFFLCDSRFFIDAYRNVLVKCNAYEALDSFNAAHGGEPKRETPLDGNSDANLEKLLRAGRWLAARNARPVLVTRGALGSLLFEPDAKSAAIKATSIPPNPVEPPIDICGAGDATNAGLAFARALGLNLVDAAYVAGVVSSITIKQIGVTGTASASQVVDALRSKEN